MFELNGKEYSFNDIYNKAQDEGVSFQEYLEFLKTKKILKGLKKSFVFFQKRKLKEN